MKNSGIQKVIQMGNGLGVIIPVAISRGLNIQRGDCIFFGVVSDNEFYVRRISERELQHLKPKILQYDRQQNDNVF